MGQRDVGNDRAHRAVKRIVERRAARIGYPARDPLEDPDLLVRLARGGCVDEPPDRLDVVERRARATAFVKR